MDDPQKLYLELYKEYRAELRHQEIQRSTVSGVFVALASALIGLALSGKMEEANTGFSKAHINVLLVNFSLGSVFISKKLYERFALARQRTNLFLAELDLRTIELAKSGELLIGTGCRTLTGVWKLSENRHNKKHNLRYRVRLHWMWEALLSGSGMIGIFIYLHAQSNLKDWIAWLILIIGPILQILAFFLSAKWIYGKVYKKEEVPEPEVPEFYPASSDQAHLTESQQA